METSRGYRIQTVLPLDIDVRGSDPDLLDDAGLAAGPFLASLARDLPYCSSLLRCVVRTSGGGFHPIFSIVPIPLMEETIGNQRLLLSVQQLFGRYFSLIGYHADPAAFGIGKSYASPENSDRVLYESERDRAWELKQEREPVLSKMHAELQRARVRFSVYNGHERTEARFAALLLDLFDDKPWQMHETTIADLHERTGIGTAILRRIIHREPLERLPWLRVEATERYGHYEVGINYDCPDLGMILARALQLTQGHTAKPTPAATPARGNYGVAALIPPELVSDGARNAAMRNYAYVLKHAGASAEETVEALVRLAVRFPSSEGARHRRRGHIRDIVRCFFRRRHTVCPPPYSVEALPPWLGEALTPLDCPNVHQHRGRSRTPPGIVPAFSQPEPLWLPPQIPDEREISPAPTSSPKRHRLYAVPHRNRVGIFDGETLVLCVTRCRNYMPRLVAAYIRRTLPRYGVGEVIVRKLRAGSAIAGAVQQIDRAAVMPSALVCGRAETACVRLARWRERQGNGNAAAAGTAVSEKEFH